MKAILFDAVGTILRPHPSVGAVYAQAAEPFGVRCGRRALERAFHRSYRALSPRRFRGDGRLQTSEERERRWWKAVVARSFREAGCGHAPREVTEAAFESFSAGTAWRPYADAVPSMEELLREGLMLGVVSNFDSRLRRVMDETGLGRYCRTLVISSEQGWAKPSPNIFLEAVRRLGVRAGEALYVGDRRKEDYLGARRSGMHALWLLRRGEKRGPSIIRSLRQIRPRLRRLPGAPPSGPPPRRTTTMPGPGPRGERRRR